MFELLDLYWHEVTAWLGLLDIVLVVLTVAWILTIKKEPTSAIAWCLLVIFLPLLGIILFLLFGYQHVSRPMRRIARHRAKFRLTHVPGTAQVLHEPQELESDWSGVGKLAQRFGEFPISAGNRMSFYYEGQPAFDAMMAAMAAAKHHIHVEFFIFHPDELGQRFLDLLIQKAKEGVEVRLLYDAIGSRRLHRWSLRSLRAVGQACAFLPLNPLRRRIQVNLRNHRKILIVDGQVAFTGGLNVGNEYLGKVPRFGYWRDTHLRVHGPNVAALQRVFAEDWDFASGEHLKGPAYFPPPELTWAQEAGHDCVTQVIHSGPDQPYKSIREVYFAAILRARQRLWIATPYFLPDAGLLDALRMAGYLGVDVRLLGQFRPDKWTPYFAGRYYWSAVLDAGVAVYQYTKGMMHSKLMLADGQWATVGTANLDNRSMHLNFEVNCMIYTPSVVAELEHAFLRDLDDSIRLDRRVFARRPFPGRLMENGCRLLAPIL